MDANNKKETDLQIQRTNQWLPVGREKGRGPRYTFLYKINKQQGYIVQHWKIQPYFVITLNGV